MQRSLSNFQVVCRVVVIGVLVFILLSVAPHPIHSQDVPTSTDAPLNSETPTESPTSTETSTPTIIPLSVESPTEVATATPTETPVEIATSELTAEPIPTGVIPATENPPAPLTISPTMTALPAEPQLNLILNDNFDRGDLSNWTLGAGWTLVPSENGQALQVNGSDESATLIQKNLGDVAAQIRVIMNTGIARLTVRQSDAGAYSVLLDLDGQVSLYRNDQRIGAASVNPVSIGTWRTIRLSVIGDLLRVTIDGVDVIMVQDNAPLPAGGISFGGIGLREGALRADDFALWVTLGTAIVTSTATPTATLKASATQPADALSGNPSLSVAGQPISISHPQVMQSMDSPPSANLQFMAYRNCSGVCPPLEYWIRDATVVSITGNGVAPNSGPNARTNSTGFYNPSLPLEINLTVAMDGIYNLNGIAASFPYYITPADKVVPHQVQIQLRGIDGTVTSQSAVCGFTPSGSTIDFNTVCPGWMNSLNYSQVHSATFIYRTAQAVDPDVISYQLGIYSIVLRTTHIVYLPTPITPTATLTPSPTNTPDPCDYNPENTEELIDAIEDANNSGIFATGICLQPNTTYSLSEAVNDYNGLPPITGHIRIIGNGAVISRSSSSVTPFRLFYVEWESELSLFDVILLNGLADTGTIPDLENRGGAIYNRGLLHITDSIINSNTAADSGGAIYNEGFVDIHNTDILNNTVTGYSGGAIANNGGEVTILGSFLSGNHVGDGITGWGGAIDSYNGGSVVITGSHIVNNSAGFAGGIDNYLGTLSIEYSMLEGNTAGINSGGAITTNGETQIHHTCIQNNNAPDGIAISNAGSEIVDAINNWWGDSSGPTHWSNSGGYGQAIGDNINYDPFLYESDCESLSLTPTPTDVNSCPSSNSQSIAMQGNDSHALSPDCYQLSTYTPVPSYTPIPEIFCISREVTSDPIGLNIRVYPTWNTNEGMQNVIRGRIRITGIYFNDGIYWLRVDPYIDPNGVATDIRGWVSEDIFQGPCEDDTSIFTLPHMDVDGNIVSVPTPIPTITPLPPVPTPEYPVACVVRTAYTPANVRLAWYSFAPIVFVFDGGVDVNVHAKTEGGDEVLGTTLWYNISFQRSNGELIVGWMHRSLLDSPTLDGGDCADIPLVERELPPTPTPPPPTPTSTPPPDLSGIFPLPMIGPDQQHQARLTARCVLHDEIPGRDVQPLGLTGDGYELRIPAPATIMVVDNDDQYNAGLGNFVSIRIDMVDVPIEIRTRLATMNTIPGNPNFRNITSSEGGSLHIGYAHIMSGTIPADIIPSVVSDGIDRNGIYPDELWPTGTLIGLSGATGNTSGAHLHVTVYYIEDNPNIAEPDYLEGWGAPNPYYSNIEHDVDFDYIVQELTFSGRPFFGDMVYVNPLVLWPSLQASTGCSFEGAG